MSTKTLDDAIKKMDGLVDKKTARDIYIYGLLTGVRDGFRTVSDACDEIIIIIEKAENEAKQLNL